MSLWADDEWVVKFTSYKICIICMNVYVLNVNPLPSGNCSDLTNSFFSRFSFMALRRRWNFYYIYWKGITKGNEGSIDFKWLILFNIHTKNLLSRGKLLPN